MVNQGLIYVCGIFALTIGAATLFVPAPALAQRAYRDGTTEPPPPSNAPGTRYEDQEGAYRAHQNGDLLSLRVIERSYIPAMKKRGADYIGSEFDSAKARYRLKFMRASAVIWVDVDGRTGQVISIAGE